MKIAFTIKLKLLEVAMLKLCIRIACLLATSLMAAHALSQELSGWSDKTVCRLVKSDGGAEYLEEATRRGIACALNTPEVTNKIDDMEVTNRGLSFSIEASKFMDEHVKQSGLLQVPMPKSNLIIKDYGRFRDYRVSHYKNNYSTTDDWLWLKEGSKGQILDKEYCHETLVKFLIPTTPNKPYKGRTERDFVQCQLSFLTYGVKNYDESLPMYERLFLEMASSKKDYWVYRASNTKTNNPTYYHLGGVLSTFFMYYATNYEAFNYTPEERGLIENYFKKKAFPERFNKDGDGRTKGCPIKNPLQLSKKIHNPNNCGSVRLRFAAGELALATITQDKALWQKGLWDLDYSLSMINDEGFFVPLSAKGCRALGYSWDTSRLFSLNVEMLKLAGFDLLNYRSRHGKTISDAYEMLFKQYEDITISNHIAKKGIGSTSCGEKPYKTHNEFIIEEFGSLDDIWVPGFGRFINWSIRFVAENHPEWIKKKYLLKVEADPFIGAYFTVHPFEIYNANVLTESNSIWAEEIAYYDKNIGILDGEYEVRWFFTGLGASSSQAQAIDTLTLSKGTAKFSGLKKDVQPSFNLRQKLSVEYYPSGEILINGNVDLWDKSIIKPIKMDGIISRSETTLIKAVWGMGDIIGLEIRKVNEAEVEKVNEAEIKKVNEIEVEKANQIEGFTNSDGLYSLDSYNVDLKIYENKLKITGQSTDEIFFAGDLGYQTSSNYFFEWADLKVLKTEGQVTNIKLSWIVKGSKDEPFSKFGNAFEAANRECGSFSDMASDSLVIIMKSQSVDEIQRHNCQTEQFKIHLTPAEFEKFRDLVDSSVQLMQKIPLVNQYFPKL